MREFSRRAQMLGLGEMRRHMRAQPAPARHHARSKQAARLIVIRKRAVEIALGSDQRIGQVLRIERGLGGAHAGVRPADERGITQQRHTALRDARRRA